MLKRFLDWLIRPKGCTCPMPARACRRRHRVMGWDYRCIGAKCVDCLPDKVTRADYTCRHCGDNVCSGHYDSDVDLCNACMSGGNT